MVPSASYVDHRIAKQLLDQDWVILALYLLISDTELSRSIAANCVDEISCCDKSCMLVTTSYFLYSHTVHAKSRLRLISVFSTIFFVIHYTETQLSPSIASPTEHFRIGVIPCNLSHLTIITIWRFLLFFV